MWKRLIAVSAAASLGLTSAATANDNDAFRELGMFGEWATDCRLPSGPTNQHIVFASSENGEVTSLTRIGIKEFQGTIRAVKIISDTRVGWRATVNGTITDVIIERIGSRYRGLESVRSDGKALVKNGFMVEQSWGAPWLEKCSSAPDASVSTQFMLDAYRDCAGKDRDRAIVGCTELIRVQPRSPFAYNFRARAYGTAGERDKAVADATEAIRIDPQYTDAYNNRAWVYLEAGQLTPGLADIQRALELAPENPAAIDTRAHIYEALGRRAEAISDYKRVLTLIPETHPQGQPTRDALKRLGASVP